MIRKATAEQTNEIKNVWQICFPDEDQKYIDYYFRALYKPENCYVYVLNGRVVSTLLRNKHVMMFDGKPLQVSMILGVATLPRFRSHGYMHALMNVVLDACEHTELITLLQSDEPELYLSFGFRMIYERTQYRLRREDMPRVTNFGLNYAPSAVDMLKVYSAYIRRFNGFYARDLKYFQNYQEETAAEKGKIIAYYNGYNQIQGYGVLIPGQNRSADLQELVYLDSQALLKIVNSALSEYRTVNLLVSEAEDLSRIFPMAQKGSYGSTMARLNDVRLFNKLFNSNIEDVRSAFSLSPRPLNLNEFD